MSNRVVDPCVDAAGQDLMGGDDEGLWFGTELSPETLHDYTEDGWRLRNVRRQVYVVNGFLGAQPFVAYVRAKSLERAREYFGALGVSDLTVARR